MPNIMSCAYNNAVLQTSLAAGELPGASQDACHHLENPTCETQPKNDRTIKPKFKMEVGFLVAFVRIHLPLLRCYKKLESLQDLPLNWGFALYVEINGQDFCFLSYSTIVFADPSGNLVSGAMKKKTEMNVLNEMSVELLLWYNLHLPTPFWWHH